MHTLTDLVHLLDATAEDRWKAGHPSSRPRASVEDRAHDATRPDDPTADAVADPARIALATAWRMAMDHVKHLAEVPRDLRLTAVAVAEETTEAHLARLTAAYSHWLGEAM
jgi:hypothetical protein